jgi:hypothetical protein
VVWVGIVGSSSGGSFDGPFGRLWVGFIRLVSYMWYLTFCDGACIFLVLREVV